MRSALRAAGLLIVAAVAITCTDAPTNPRQGGMVPGRLTMAPSFSAEAAQVYGRLAALGLDITEVHVRLTAADGSTRDTVIAFPLGQDQLVIEIPVSVTGTDQAFNALIELRNDQHVVLFSGTQTVIARAANLPPLTPPVVTINYTGPGKGTKTVTVSPPDTSVTANAAIPFSATGIDSSNKAVTDLLVGWTISDATLATITPGSNISATITGLGKRGVATVTATTPQGVSGSSRVTFVPPAARVVVIGGGGQTGVAGSALLVPFVVEVQASDNLPVPGARVNFRAITAGGSVQAATATADGNGRASTLLTLGRTAGTYQYEASSGTLPPVTVSGTATPAPAAAIAIVSGNGQVDSVGRQLPLPLVVKVTDQFGGDVSGATVTWTRVAGNGTVSAASSATGATGTASINYTLGSAPSSDTVRASVGGVATSVLFSMKAVNRGPASIAIIAGNNQTGAPNSTLPTALVARVRDAQNNVIAGQSVTWTATGAGVTFATPASLTDASGLATTAVTLGAVAGVTTVTVTAGTISTTAQLTIAAGPAASITKTAGDLQTVAAGTAVPVAPTVTIKDAANNPVPNAPVVFAVASGGGSVTGASTTTNASGVATVGSWTLGGVAGANSLTATSGSLVATFTATGTAAVPAKIALVNPVPATITVGQTFTPVPAQLLDANNNPVPLAGVVITATGNVQPSNTTFVLTATTNASGTASFQPLPYTGKVGTLTFTLTAPNVTPLVTQAITVLTGPAVQLVVATHAPSSVVSGAVLAPQPAIQVADAGGNPVSGSGVSVLTTLIGTGTLGGTTTALTNAGGLATFTNLAINAPASVLNLQYSSGTLASVRDTVTVTANAPATVTKIAGDAQSATAGTAVAVSPSVSVLDATGAPVIGVPVTFVVASGGGSVTGGSATTNASGVATMGTWTLGSTAGQNSLTVTAGAVTTTFTATATAGAASSIIISNGDGQSAVAGTAVPIAPQVLVVDGNGNAVGNVQVTFAVASGGGSVTGAVTSTNLAGLASVGSWTLGTTAGANSLTATAGSASTTFTATGIAGTASQLTFTTPPPTTAVGGQLLSPQPVVQLRDAAGNAVATAGVNIAMTATGPYLLVSSGAVTDATGKATFTDIYFTGPGAHTITFSAVMAGSPSVTSAPINVTPGTVTQLVTLAAPQTGAILSTLPQPVGIEARDANNRVVPGVALALQPMNNNTTTNGTPSATSITTDATGRIAFGWKLGRSAKTDTVLVSVGAAQVFATAVATAGPASQLIALTPQPLLANNAIPTGGTHWAPYVVIVSDSGGIDTVSTSAAVSVQINGASNTPDAALLGTTTVNAVNGVATFPGLAINPAFNGYRMDVDAPSLTGVPTLTTSTFTINIGPVVKLEFIQEPSGGAAGTPLTPTILVAAVDSGGNHSNLNTPLYARLAIFSGPAGATITGDSAVFVAGDATFANAVVSLSGNYALTVSSPNGSLPLGGPIPTDTTGVFTVSANGTLSAKTGSRFIALPLGSTPAPVFQAKTLAGAPIAGEAIDLNTVGRCTFAGNTQFVSMITDANGEVAPALSMPNNTLGYGCTVQASSALGGGQRDSSLIAMYPSGTTHVWNGLTSFSWNTASNWFVTPPAAGATVPSATSDVFITGFGVSFNAPVVQTRATVRRLVMDTSAVVNLNGVGMDVGNGGVAGFGILVAGTTHLAATASLSGVFDQLDIGQSGSCGAAGPMTGTLLTTSISTLNIYCRTNIDTTTVSTSNTTVFPNAGQGQLHLTSNRALLGVGSKGRFTGDVLNVTGGQIYVSDSAFVGGASVTFTGGVVSTNGPAIFNSAAATYNSAVLLVQNNAVFGGTGAGQQNFAGGSLTVYGDLTQLTGTVASAPASRRTFNTSSDHVTTLSGSGLQTVSITDDSTSQFSIVKVSKPAGTTALFATRATLINGTTQPRLDIISGKAEVGVNSFLSLGFGGLRLGGTTTLTITGTLTSSGSCTGRALGAIITGTGFYNTALASSLPGTFCQ